MTNFQQLPQASQDVQDWSWEQFQPFADALLLRDLTAEALDDWLLDWTHLYELIQEVYTRLYVAVTVDTQDEAAEARFNDFIDTVMPAAQIANDALNRKLIASGLEPANFAVPLRNMRAEVEIFREDNVALQTREEKLSNEYDRIIGAQTVQWDGEERTIAQMRPLQQVADRATRERAWRLASERQLSDRDALNELWGRMLTLRVQMAKNAGFDDYRAYRWKVFNRFDYTPDDALTFHRAIEQVVVPAAARIHDRRRRRMGLDALRPWDLSVDPQGRQSLQPFQTAAELAQTTEAIFRQVDPQLGDYVAKMRHDHLLDLDNRKGKSPGGYCTTFDRQRLPFIFMNAVGLHDDVQTMLHESGHAFHVFEARSLPYIQQQDAPIEFAEVASMAMELLAAPFMEARYGGFYDAEETARARVEHLEEIVLFWPFMAVVDAFQHWVYTHADEAQDTGACDAKWLELWGRYMVGVDYSGLDEWVATGWQRKLHIFQIPFYYIEYGLAQLGAVQVWANSLTDAASALQQYRQALALGGTATLPELFRACGAHFAFDTDTLSEAVALIEQTLGQLDPA